MPRPRQYDSDASRQAAYRDRKRDEKRMLCEHTMIRIGRADNSKDWYGQCQQCGCLLHIHLSMLAESLHSLPVPKTPRLKGADIIETNKGRYAIRP